jgi:hypothetical protein
MTTINRPTNHGPTAIVDGSAATDSAGRPTPQLILDGVIASYIHEISERHPRRQTAGDDGALSEPAGLPS